MPRRGAPGVLLVAPSDAKPEGRSAAWRHARPPPFGGDGAPLAIEAPTPCGAPSRLFSIPGHAFCIALDAMPSASSWREVRSDLQVEPRAARVRHACRPRGPHLAPLNQDASGRRPSERGECNVAELLILVKDTAPSSRSCEHNRNKLQCARMIALTECGCRCSQWTTSRPPHGFRR